MKKPLRGASAHLSKRWIAFYVAFGIVGAALVAWQLLAPPGALVTRTSDMPSAATSTPSPEALQPGSPLASTSTESMTAAGGDVGTDNGEQSPKPDEASVAAETAAFISEISAATQDARVVASQLLDPSIPDEIRAEMTQRLLAAVDRIDFTRPPSAMEPAWSAASGELRTAREVVLNAQQALGSADSRSQQQGQSSTTTTAQMLDPQVADALSALQRALDNTQRLLDQSRAR